MRLREILSLRSAGDAVNEAALNTPISVLLPHLETQQESFGMTTAELLKFLVNAAWDPYDHPGVVPPAVAYATKVTFGPHVRVMATGDMRPDDEIVFDTNTTGVVMGTALGYELGPVTDIVTVLLGPDPDPKETRPIVWALLAGNPVVPSSMPAAEWAGKVVLAEDAINAGVEYVRVEGRRG